MTPKQFQDHLIKLEACWEAREWAKGKSWEEVYTTCHRGDWLAWLAEKQGVDKRLLVLVGGHIANTVRHLMKDKRSTDYVDTCIAYGEGGATDEELEAAVRAAWAAGAAGADNQQQSADIVRKFIPIEKFGL
jgi:hypothetical protein